MKPIATTSSMKMGSANESNIADHISTFLEANSPTAGGATFVLDSICEVGLAGRKDQASISTSVDRLGRFCITSRTPDGHTSTNQTIMAVEIKSLTTDDTERKGYNRITQHSETKRLIFVKFGTAQFKHFVWTVSYRCQVLHHRIP